MEKAAYVNIGKAVLDLKAFDGINFSYKKANSSIKLHSEQNLTNATFSGEFRLEPGSFTITSSNKSGLDIRLRPDLKSFDTELEIDPLLRNFKFSINKACHKTGAAFKLTYDSATQKPELIVYPAFKCKRCDVKGEVTINNFQHIPAYHFAATIGHTVLRHFYQIADNSFRFGAFHSFGDWKCINDIHLGIAGGFKALALPSDTYFFAQAKIKHSHISLILSKEEATKTGEIRVLSPVLRNYLVATSVKCVEKNPSASLGIRYTCPQTFGTLSGTIDTNKVFKAIAKIPLHKFLKDSTLGLAVTLPDVTAVSRESSIFGISLDLE